MAASGVQSSRADHSYAGKKQPPIGRIPSKFGPDHTYVTRYIPSNTTPTKRPSGIKRTRSGVTATGKTPLQISEWPTTLTHTKDYCVWKTSERKFLLEYAHCTPRSTQESVAEYWQRCADLMNKEFPASHRNGNACKSLAQRLLITPGSVSPKLKLHKNDVGSQTEFPDISDGQTADWVLMEPKKEQMELVSGQWLGLTKVTFRDPAGKERTWEALQRMTKKPNAPADAVIIIPILKRSLHYDCYILVKQYRPPTKGYTIEFPAGLIDENENVVTCALRELKEETGYTGVAKHTSPVTSLDPGTANTTGQIVTVEIDGDSPENQNPKPQPDEGEFIEVLTIPKEDFLQKLNEYSEKGIQIDARLYMYAVALEQTKKT